jgi:nucleotide-binding universal stress UspA family protein
MNDQTHKDRIVVGVDLLETGDHALREALRLCQRLPGSELHVSHVIFAEPDLHDASELSRLERLLPARLEELQAHVAKVCQPERTAGALSQATVFHLRVGDAASALHQVAVDVDADLIVVGTHARRGVDKLLLGSVAQSLIQTARVPVLVARPKDFTGLVRTQRPEASRPGEDLHAKGLSRRLQLELTPRSSHIPGLI